MNTYSQMTTLQLRTRLEHLEKVLAAYDPEVADEIRLIRQFIAKKDRPRTVSYADVETPWRAISICLDQNQDFTMGKAEVRAEIINGGYQSGADGNANDLIRDAINYHIRMGRLELKKNLLGRTAEGFIFAG